MQETEVQSLGWEDPLQEEMATHSSILAGRILWTVQSMGSQRVRHNWATNTLKTAVVTNAVTEMKKGWEDLNRISECWEVWVVRESRPEEVMQEWMWADEEKGRKSVYRQATVQRPDRDQSEPEGQEESSFWKRELEEEGEAGEVEGSQTLLGSAGLSRVLICRPTENN